MMRVGLFKPVHVKTLAAQEQRMLLTSRKLIQHKLLAIECDMRGTLRNFGLKVGVISTAGYDARIRHLVESFPKLAAIVEPLLTVRRVMRQQLATLHKMLLDTVRHDPVCRRFMTAPGVGPVVALTYRASVDQPHRFVHSRAVGAHAGLTPKRHQSGETDYDGGISKCGDTMLRAMLYEAAQSMLTHSKKCRPTSPVQLHAHSGHPAALAGAPEADMPLRAFVGRDGWEAAGPLPGIDASNPEICVWARLAGSELQDTARLCRCRFKLHIANGKKAEPRLDLTRQEWPRNRSRRSSTWRLGNRPLHSWRLTGMWRCRCPVFWRRG